MGRSISRVAMLTMFAALLAAGVAQARDSHSPTTSHESLRTASATSRDLRASHVFPETGYSVSGRFLDFWERNGGVAVFGYPISPELAENGRPVQYFERQRFELHPENDPPYDVLLGRLGDEVLQRRGIDWRALPVIEPIEGCLFIPETQRNICDHADGTGFRTFWERHNRTAQADAARAGSLALFGYPLTDAYPETSPDGATVLTQWFERARFEWHPGNPDAFKVLLGRLGAEVAPPSVPEAQPDADLVRRGREALARHLGFEAGRLTLQRADAVEWPSSALGCPAPDQVYLQVITPGWRLMFADAARSYAVHTNERGSTFILCQNERPIPLP